MQLDVIDKYKFMVNARYIIFILSATAVFVWEYIKSKRTGRPVNRTAAYVFASAAGLSCYNACSLIFKLLIPYFGRHPMQEILLGIIILLAAAGLVIFAADLLRSRSLRKKPRFASNISLFFSLAIIASFIFYYYQDLVLPL